MKTWLFEIRKAKQMSGEDIARDVGISYKSYNAYENNRRRPSVETAKKIAAVLGFPWTRFFEEQEGEGSCLQTENTGS